MVDLFNKKYVFLFQGVGSDYREFLDILDEKQIDSLKKYCESTIKEIDLNLGDYLFYGKENKFEKTFNAWIAIYTIDCIIYETYIESGLRPDLMLGYSMGLITAMTCSEAISYKIGLKILMEIYNYPKNTNRNRETMATIIGKRYDEVDNIIIKSESEEYVNVAAENNEQCIVISGKEEYIDKIINIAEEEGAIKAIKINTPYAIHSPYAKVGIRKFEKFIAETDIKNLKTPIFSVLNQDIIKNSNELKKELIKNMYTPMKWKGSLIEIKKLNINDFVEVSLEDSLTKISRLIDMNFKFMTYKKFLRKKKNN